MALGDRAFNVAQTVRKQLGVPLHTTNLDSFMIGPEEARSRCSQSMGELHKLVFAHQGRTVHKWLQYLEVYARHFAAYRNTPVRMLEIGVDKGGSLEIWRKYFGEDAVIFGIDIDPECASRVSPPNQVRIGSQADLVFLRSLIDEMGTPDIVLDDGSHWARHQRVSFDTLFPLLREGGLYVIEDLHTAYFHGAWEGGYRRRGTAIERVKDMIDDMHAWYHTKKTTTPARDQIVGIHVYDSIVFIEKKKVERPCCTKIG